MGLDAFDTILYTTDCRDLPFMVEDLRNTQQHKVATNRLLPHEPVHLLGEIFILNLTKFSQKVLLALSEITHDLLKALTLSACASLDFQIFITRARVSEGFAIMTF